MRMTEGEFRALLEREHHHRVQFFRDAFMAIAFNGISGDYVEFGSHGGMTFGLAHQESRRHGIEPHLWAFDSFQGLPASTHDGDLHPQWAEGKLATSLSEFRETCERHGIPPEHYTTVVGYYEESLPPLAGTGKPTDICLAYVDCDQFSSTTAVLRFLAPRLKPSMIVAFDDYFCFSPTGPSGERLAHLEFQVDHPQWRFVPYLSYGWHGMSYVVEVS